MAVFAAVFMIPMLYRFTQSSHPRSGLVGCMSFVVVSLGANVADGHPSIVQIAWTRGLAFMVGTISAVVVNWMLWPFVARHELRKALSAMMVYSSIIYRGKPPLRGVYAGLIVHRPGVVAKYVYYEQGKEPDKEDIEGSGWSCPLVDHHIPNFFQKSLKDVFGKVSSAFVNSWSATCSTNQFCVS